MSLLDKLSPDLDRVRAGVAGFTTTLLRDAAAAATRISNDTAAQAAALQQLADAYDAQRTATQAGIDTLAADIAASEPPPPPPPPPSPPPPVRTAAKPVGLRSGWLGPSIWRHPNGYTTTVQPAFLSFEEFRRRRLDGLHVFIQGQQGVAMDQWPARTWPTAKGATPGAPGEGVLWWLARDGIPAFLTWPLLTDLVPAGKDRYVALARGDYDKVHAQVAAQVRATGAKVVTVRLGHEINMGNPASVYPTPGGPPVAGSPVTYPWSLAYCQGDFELAGAGWSRIATLLKNELPGVLIDLNSLRRFDQPCTYGATFDQVYGPFLAAADIISGEGYLTQDIANPAVDIPKFMTAGSVDHPAGPETWAQCADAHGKLYAVPEWGPAMPKDKVAVRDIPQYVLAMREHFDKWGRILAYEANFGNDDIQNTGYHSLWNPVSVPLCSAAYQQAWSLPAAQWISRTL